MKSTILIVDDDPDAVDVLQGFLTDKYNILTANTGSEAFEVIDRESPDLMLLDIDLPDISGIAILERLKESSSEIPTLIVSGTGNVKSAVKAMQLGAYNYIEKPPDYEEVRTVVKKIIESNDLKKEVHYLRTESRQNRMHPGGKIIGGGKKITETLEIINKAGKTHANVLITGESGTGKEMVAHAIHDGSDRKDKPFVVVSCPNLPTELVESELFGHEKGAFTGAIQKHVGKFEIANNGTIFLDEIAELQPSVQARLLRVIQEREFSLVGGGKTIKVDVRIVAATNRQLKDEIANGNFREDLYYRLNVIPVTLPPLRQRIEDIPLLTTHFIEHFKQELHCKAAKFSSKAIESLQEYDWPGNIRELRNVIERALSLYGDCETITPDHLPTELAKNDDDASTHVFELSKIKSLENVVSSVEKDLITQALQQSKGKLAKAARLLKMDPWKLRYKAKKLKLDETIVIDPE
ncbi:MAG: sigma-54-dependent transcriptional regulator [Candidatus Anammoxibacter sp.]